MPSNSWFDFVVIVYVWRRPVNGNDDDIKSPLTMDKLSFLKIHDEKLKKEEEKAK